MFSSEIVNLLGSSPDTELNLHHRAPGFKPCEKQVKSENFIYFISAQIQLKCIVQSANVFSITSVLLLTILVKCWGLLKMVFYFQA